jgi:hypothetical protein
VTVRFNEPTAINGLKAYPDGQIEFLRGNDPVTAAEAHVEISYERPKGPKSITRAPASGFRWPSHPHDALANADLIYWVDTNSREVGGQWIHATAAIIGEPSHTLNRTYVKFQVAHGFEFRGTVSKPERLAWCEVIEGLRRNPARLLNWNVYLVVDSDLDALSEINARTMTVWNDYGLPPRFQFVYASAEVGMEFPLNSVMARCDRMAGLLLDQIIRQDPTGSAIVERSLIGAVPMRSWNPID